VAQCAPGKADYFVWGVIDWHFRHQRPQQLAKVLAQQGHRVFYISSELLDRDNAGFEAEALDPQGRLLQIKLFARPAPVIYYGAAQPDQVRQLHEGLGQLLQWADCQRCVSLVDHPFWTPIAQALPDHCLIYDCMDNHAGFGNNSAELLAMETALLASADLTLFTSNWLEQAFAGQTRHSCVVRNAADYAHFAQPPAQCFQDSQGRRIIGYYGAIAEWFDLAVVSAIAERFSDCCILLVGADTVQAAAQLCRQDNVMFTGEVPYALLPYYLHAFDVCLLPFRVMPLTLATNPVKVYEYLSAGKPVVCTDLPEIQQFTSHVRTARDIPDYLATIATLLADDGGPTARATRQAFAREQTWDQRMQVLLDAVTTAGQPAISVIIVTYNNLTLTRQCLASLESDSAVLGVIVVDNASSDGTPDYLREWASQASDRKLVLNSDNRGFSAANNQGLAIAVGDYLMLLNNDTQVLAGALRTLQNHLQRDPHIGLIGPVTNNIGNEAKIDLGEEADANWQQAAARYTRAHCGRVFEIRTLAFFAVMMPRKTYATLGPLDEAFGLGFFEDDDYCRRAEQAGLQSVCAEDAFIHHHLSAAFDAMEASARMALFDRNKQLYEARWGQWQPHVYRT
jgi:GT2 family glycosyltransferase/glycosyltransferase involved in cell wall biosynthesis